MVPTRFQYWISPRGLVQPGMLSGLLIYSSFSTRAPSEGFRYQESQKAPNITMRVIIGNRFREVNPSTGILGP